ncbi:hypothetical protein ACTA71_000294 [Dictyostelium dimigraforme]
MKIIFTKREKNATMSVSSTSDRKDHFFLSFGENGSTTTTLNQIRELKRATTVDYVYRDHLRISVFDLYFRKSLFGGEFTVFADLEEVIRFIPDCEQDFLDYLSKLDSSSITLYAIKEGSVEFPRVPLIRVEGPMILCQLFETTLLCLVNFASLIATNATRHRLAVGEDKVMLGFGLRRAQGPDGAMSASRYSYLGGADGTSNVLAHCFFGIPIRGTHAHSFIANYSSPDELLDATIKDTQNNYRDKLGFTAITSELVAFVAYARTFPNGIVAMVDTYDTLSSGVPNFICVAFLTHQWGST